MTATVYAHVLLRTTAEAAERLERVFARGRLPVLPVVPVAEAVAEVVLGGAIEGAAQASGA